jgi:hypothetical protein
MQCLATQEVTRRETMSSTLSPDRHFFAPFWNKPGHVEVIKEIEAPMTRLDPLFERESIVADAIKIDVQGGEAAVISGANQSFRLDHPGRNRADFAARYEGQVLRRGSWHGCAGSASRCSMSAG